MTKDKKISIFDILNKIDDGDYKAYEEVEKDFNPYMTMKWLASCKDPVRIRLVNEIINPLVFHLNQDKELMYYLMCSISDGKRKRYNWVKRYKNPNKEKEKIISEYFKISLREAKDSGERYNMEEVVEMMVEMGYTDKEIKKVIGKIK